MDKYKELVDRLRRISEYDSIPLYKPHLMRQELIKAADIAEEMYEKLKYMNCDGEWVYCLEGEELPCESGKYNVITTNWKIFADYEFDAENKVWIDEEGNFRYVIAWWRKYEFEI